MDNHEHDWRELPPESTAPETHKEYICDCKGIKRVYPNPDPTLSYDLVFISAPLENTGATSA